MCNIIIKYSILTLVKILFLAINCTCIFFLSCRSNNTPAQKKQILIKNVSSAFNKQIFPYTISTEKNTTYVKSSDPADSVWSKVLNTIKLPMQTRQDCLINVYFKYNQIVNNYEVTARFMPFDALSETGYAVLNFRDTKKGHSFQYINIEKYTNFNIDEIRFSDKFSGFCDGNIYYLEYIQPNISNSFLLGYYTPFQFLDIDFHGKNELLINDWGQYKGGNYYSVYKIIGGELILQDYIPSNYLFTTNIIDTSRKTITLDYTDGYYDQASYFFSKQKRKPSAFKIPDLKGGGQWIIEEFYKQRNHSFSLDSVHYFLNDTTYIYRMTGNELRLITFFIGNHLSSQ